MPRQAVAPKGVETECVAQCALAASRYREAKALNLADEHAEVTLRWRTWAARFYKTAGERIAQLEEMVKEVEMREHALALQVSRLRADLMRAQSGGR